MIRAAQRHNGEAGEIRVTHASSAMNTVVPSFLLSAILIMKNDEISSALFQCNPMQTPISAAPAWKRHSLPEQSSRYD